MHEIQLLEIDICRKSLNYFTIFLLSIFCRQNFIIIDKLYQSIQIQVPVRTKIKQSQQENMLDDTYSDMKFDMASIKHSDCFSDILNFEKVNNSIVEQILQPQQPKQVLETPLQNKICYEDGQVCYRLLFSPKNKTQSLAKRNQMLQMKCFQNSDSEPEQIFFRREKRLSNLKTNADKQGDIFQELKMSDSERYQAMVIFMQIFVEVKCKIKSLRNDYYSNKTFMALRNTSESDLLLAAAITKKMKSKIIDIPVYQNRITQQIAHDRLTEFLIIPRFLISKQKIIRFIKDEQLQHNFEFLVSNSCLGHYNNQANKKMPEEEHLKYVRNILRQKKGRQKFKRICSINHGGKFFKTFGDKYYELYFKSLDCLNHIDHLVKKGVKQKKIHEQMDKYPREEQQLEQDYQQPMDENRYNQYNQQNNQYAHHMQVNIFRSDPAYDNLVRYTDPTYPVMNINNNHVNIDNNTNNNIHIESNNEMQMQINDENISNYICEDFKHKNSKTYANNLVTSHNFSVKRAQSTPVTYQQVKFNQCNRQIPTPNHQQSQVRKFKMRKTLTYGENNQNTLLFELQQENNLSKMISEDDMYAGEAMVEERRNNMMGI